MPKAGAIDRGEPKRHFRARGIRVETGEHRLVERAVPRAHPLQPERPLSDQLASSR